MVMLFLGVFLVIEGAYRLGVPMEFRNWVQGGCLLLAGLILVLQNSIL